VSLSTTGTLDPLQYSWGPSGPLVAKAGTTERVLVTDAHADVVASTTVGTAQVAGTRTYTPWGETRTDTAGFSRPIELGFQSDPTSGATGLVDVGIRHLLARVGRFTTRDVVFGDPSNPVSLNQYAYGGANPVTMADPTGMASRNGVGARTAYAQQCVEAREGFCAEDTSNPISERIWGAFALTASIVVLAAAPEIAMWTATRAAPAISASGAAVTSIATRTATSVGEAPARAAAWCTTRNLCARALNWVNGVSNKAGLEDEVGDPPPPGPYVRPASATTPAQRASVQSMPCVECGEFAPKMVADHSYPLVREWYETGTINLARMRSLEAVQPMCPACSASQGGQLSWYSRLMKVVFGFE